PRARSGGRCEGPRRRPALPVPAVARRPGPRLSPPALPRGSSRDHVRGARRASAARGVRARVRGAWRARGDRPARARRRRAVARALVGDRRPLQVLLYARRRAHAAVARLLARERFDVVHAQLVRTATYLPDAGGPPVVVDLVDALSANFARRARRDRGPLAWVS